MSKEHENEMFLYALSCRSFQLRSTNSANVDLLKKYFYDCCRILDHGARKGIICTELKDYIYEDLLKNNQEVLMALCNDEDFISRNKIPMQFSPEFIANIFKSTSHRAISDMEYKYGQSDDVKSLLRSLREAETHTDEIIICGDLPKEIGTRSKESNGSKFGAASKYQLINSKNTNKGISKPEPVIGFRTASGGPLKRQKSTSDDKRKRRFIPPLATVSSKDASKNSTESFDPSLPKNIDPKLAEVIMSEVVGHSKIEWDDISGLDAVKQAIKEIVIWPLLRPDIFVGLRGPPRGLLLFGPPGTGKTLIGKCIASQSNAKFFSISASSLTSKWEGEGEKLVRTMFAVASSCAPSVIFVDEIDSLLTRRRESENEATRRIKTEFLVQMDGICTKSSSDSENRILLIGATNRPQELDEAARRRFTKRLYVPLPEAKARKVMIIQMMKDQMFNLSENEIDVIVSLTDGFSGADMSTLCSESAMGPIRRVAFNDISTISADQVEPVCILDFQDALQTVKASVSHSDLGCYQKWNSEFGSFQY